MRKLFALLPLLLLGACDWHPTTPDARFESGAKVTTFAEDGSALAVYTGRVKYMRNGDILLIPCDQDGEITIQQPFEIRFGNYCR